MGATQKAQSWPDRAVAVEEGDGRGAGRVDRGVADRDGDEVAEQQPEPDGERGEALGGVVLGRAEDDVDEEGGDERLDDEHAAEARSRRGSARRSRWPRGCR